MELSRLYVCVSHINFIFVCYVHVLVWWQSIRHLYSSYSNLAPVAELTRNTGCG